MKDGRREEEGQKNEGRDKQKGETNKREGRERQTKEIYLKNAERNEKEGKKYIRKE